MRDLQAQAARADAAAAELEAALQERSRQLAVLSAQLDEAQAEIQAVKLQGAEDLDELIARVDRAEKRASSALAAQAELEQELTLADSHPADHERLESVLKERARVVRELEEELARRDRLVRDLAGALEEAHGASPEGTQPASAGAAEGALKERLDALALELARRESSARAADWTIAELERRLAIAEQGATSPSGEGDVGGRLSAALEEVDALRQALVQEHEARRRAETGAVDPTPREGTEGTEGTGGRGSGRHEHEEGRQGT
jgi:chromosome segregation ATPase